MVKKNYNFSLLTKSVDEIILLNVSRNKSMVNDFCKTINSFQKNVLYLFPQEDALLAPKLQKFISTQELTN